MHNAKLKIHTLLSRTRERKHLHKTTDPAKNYALLNCGPSQDPPPRSSQRSTLTSQRSRSRRSPGSTSSPSEVAGSRSLAVTTRVEVTEDAVNHGRGEVVVSGRRSRITGRAMASRGLGVANAVAALVAVAVVAVLNGAAVAAGMDGAAGG